jgi:hypothetical protein
LIRTQSVLIQIKKIKIISDLFILRSCGIGSDSNHIGLRSDTLRQSANPSSQLVLFWIGPLKYDHFARKRICPLPRTRGKKEKEKIKVHHIDPVSLTLSVVWRRLRLLSSPLTSPPFPCSTDPLWGGRRTQRWICYQRRVPL